MSTKAAKGKGKPRGGGIVSQARGSGSRNTTPASVSAFSADTLSSEFAGPSAKVTYEDIMERLSIGDNPGIPSSATLGALNKDLRALEECAKARSRAADRGLREVQAKLEVQKVEKAEEELAQKERDRKAVEDIERKEKIKLKKRKAEPEHKRPPAIGAHQTTQQTPSNDVIKVEKRKIRLGTPEVTQQSNSSNEGSEVEVEHQPPQTAPFVVFEPLKDDPAVYEIPKVSRSTPHDEKARAFAVARFPAGDLSKLIPGDPPDEDFSKSKPTNQVAINTFNSYIEPYFRPFSEEDLAFLRERGDRITPYIIPKAGKHYSEQWAEEDGPGVTFASPAPTACNGSSKASAPKGKPDDVNEESLDKEDISCGPLLSRLLAAYIPEDSEDTENLDPQHLPLQSPQPPQPQQPPAGQQLQQTPMTNGDSTTPAPINNSATALINPGDPSWKVSTGKMDYATLEERIRREMIYVGLMDPTQELDFDNRQDDEVSARLRMLQKQLRKQTIINGARKARIAEQLKEQLAYQEYVTILEDLDKQVEQAFAKRSRNMKASKKKKNAPNGVGVAQARVGIGEQAKMLMERRKRWVETIGPVFDKDLTVLPNDTIFSDMDELKEREKIGATEEE